jgi:hypothetical protein
MNAWGVDPTWTTFPPHNVWDNKLHIHVVAASSIAEVKQYEHDDVARP